MEKETMQDLRKQEDERSREHWAFVESVANRVGNWPLWKQAATLTASHSVRNPPWKPPSQKRWDEIFGKTEKDRDRDRASCVQLHIAFEEPKYTLLYFDKSFVANLKANTPFTKPVKHPLPKTASGILAMYQYASVNSLGLSAHITSYEDVNK